MYATWRCKEVLIIEIGNDDLHRDDIQLPEPLELEEVLGMLCVVSTDERGPGCNWELCKARVLSVACAWLMAWWKTS